MELWLVNGQLVAQQQAYSFPYMKESYHEVRHYYCPRCGTVWGMRADPSAVSPRHYFYRQPCGGDMLNPWETEHIDALGPNVLAYLILQTAPGEQHE